MTVTSASTSFVDRHIGARRQADVDAMLKAVGYDTVDALVDTAVPKDIRQDSALALGQALSEVEVLAELRKLAAKNKTAVQMIGQGYYDTLTPAVIRRNILEAPAWYTAYTPYQPEISQGRLEALLNFQTMVQDLVGLPIANASLLDEATAVAEAVLMMRRANKNKTAHDGKTVLDADCLPQTIAIVKGRAEALGFEVEVADLSKGLPDGVINGVVLQQPGASGRVFDHTAVIADAKERGALVTVAADLLSLTLITPPGRAGRRHRRRLRPALRRPAVLRRPARRLHGGPEGPRAVHARPPGRRLQGQRRRPGLPPGPADPRAAHPPREGHLQHLHRAGPAGDRVLLLRRLPRPGRPQGHRRDHPRPRPDHRRLAEGRGPGRAAHQFLRHRDRLGPRQGRADHRRRRRQGHQPARHRRGHRRHLRR